MFEAFAIEAFSAILSAIWLIVLVVLFVTTFILFLYFKHRQDEERTIPPLDLIDAKKLDDMVVRQVEASLKPLLLSKGYAEAQVNEILTRTTGVGKTFRR